MVVMQRLSGRFEQHSDIRLRWVVPEENVLRQRVTTDIAARAGQFDVPTIGNYEVPIRAKQVWLSSLDNLPADYDVGTCWRRCATPSATRPSFMPCPSTPKVR
jgi:sorbitol/mannitol transport system substrate-binding protein